MLADGLEGRITALLCAANQTGGLPMSLVCTDQGLLIAGAGDPSPWDDLAALASIFDDVVARARQNLGMLAVDELAVRDDALGRFVIRPLHLLAEPRMFLVVQVPPSTPWRRTTNRLCVELEAELRPFACEPGVA